MNFSIERSIEVLKSSPDVLSALLSGLHTDWIYSNEGPDTFSPFDVVGHLIHGEKTDWKVRMDMILNSSEEPFPPYDRFAQYESSKGKTILQLLTEFKELRKMNVDYLESLNLSEQDLTKTGLHPALGKVSLKNLLSTWVAHDLSHIAQIARVMGKQYKEEVGPWLEYLPYLTRN